MAVTLSDIARKLGVTHVTVSRALRDDPKVAMETRFQIKELAQHLGYHPNNLARGLKGGKTQTVGILWNLGGPHTGSNMANEIALRMHNHSYVTYLADPLGLWEATRKILFDYIHRKVDAVVVQGDETLLSDLQIKQQLSMFSAAVVVVPIGLPGFKDQIVLDRTSAIHEIVEHFAKIGRRRPAFFLPINDANKVKVDVFGERIRYHGIEFSPDTILDLNLPTGFYNQIAHYSSEALNRLFPIGRPPFDALLCSADEVATAAIAWLRSRGLKVPEDVSVVGFNDNDGSGFLFPPLASVNRRDMEVADAIEAMLFSRLEKPDLPPQQKEIEMKFIWRESAG